MPTVDDFVKYMSTHKIAWRESIKKFIEHLNKKKIDIYLCSQSFSPLVERIAKELSIPLDNIFSVVLLFDKHGKYLSFDESSPTSESGGVQRICNYLKITKNYKCIYIIGTGYEEMAAIEPGNKFILFRSSHTPKRIKSKEIVEKFLAHLFFLRMSSHNKSTIIHYAKRELIEFSDMWMNIMQWVMISSSMIGIGCCIICLIQMRDHWLNKFVSVFLLFAGLINCLLPSMITTLAIVGIYHTSGYKMLKYHACAWGIGQTVMFTIVSFTKLLPML
ncbi:hypothetical protein SNEBB_006179 [Seison nebaliae]|nr:hypothetical protein SNEBB_006179 [Seison nebaliae]